MHVDVDTQLLYVCDVCKCVSTICSRLDHIIASIQFKMNIESKLNYFMGFTTLHQRDYIFDLARSGSSA